MELKIRKIDGNWAIVNEKGEIFQAEEGSNIDDMNIIDLVTTLCSFEGIKAHVDWTN